MPLSKQVGCFKAQMILVNIYFKIERSGGFANLIMSILCYFSFFINLPLKQSVWICVYGHFLFSVLSSQHYSYFGGLIFFLDTLVAVTKSMDIFRVLLILSGT